MRRLREFIVVNVLLAVFIIIMVSLHPVNDIRKYDIYDQFEFTHRAIIYGDRSVSQEFTCNMDCDSIEIQAATIKLCDGRYNVVLKDETGNELRSWTAEEIDLSGERVSFRCDHPVMKAGNRYVLEVSAPECDISRAIVVALEEDVVKSSSLGIFNCINYEEQEEAYYADKAMSIAVFRSHKNVFAYISFLIIIIAINLCLAFKDKGIALLAPVVLIASCFVMLFALSPGSGLDDEYHYYSAFKLSNIMMGRENAGEVETMYAYDLIPDVNANYNFMNVLENIRYRKTGDGTMFIMDGHSDRLRWPISHFGPAVGITIGRLLKMNFVQIYTMGRITSMIMYIFMVLAAIRLTPVNKELMLLLASTPMVTQQATQITYDTVVNGMSFLLVGYILYLMFDVKRIEWKNVLAVVIMAGLLGPVKVIYSVLVLLVMAIPKSSFSTQKDRILKISVMAMSVFMVTLINKYSAGKGTLTGTDIRIGRPGYTLDFAIHDPVRYIVIILRSIEEDITFYVKQAIGMQLGGRDVEIPELYVFGLIILLVLCVCYACNGPVLDGLQRVIWIGVAVIGSGGLFGLFVFGATAYGNAKITGLQGRYYIPFVIPLMYAMRSQKAKIEIERSKILILFWFLQLGCLIHIMSQVNYTV